MFTVSRRIVPQCTGAGGLRELGECAEFYYKLGVIRPALWGNPGIRSFTYHFAMQRVTDRAVFHGREDSTLMQRWRKSKSISRFFHNVPEL